MVSDVVEQQSEAMLMLAIEQKLNEQQERNLMELRGKCVVCDAEIDAGETGSFNYCFQHRFEPYRQMDRQLDRIAKMSPNHVVTDLDVSRVSTAANQ